jgi:nitroreductase
MKNFTLIIAIIMLMSIIKEGMGQNAEKYPNETIKTIHSRKSVRHFTDKKVTREQLETLVKAGMAAPSAMNRQPWAFVIVTDRKKLDSLAAGSPNAQMLNKASAAIIVCGETKKAYSSSDANYWVLDCSAASENILLAAESMGLGALWTGAYPNRERIAFISKSLHLPEHVIPLNIIPIGYPTGEDKPKNKYKPENVHWNKW